MTLEYMRSLVSYQGRELLCKRWIR